MIVGALLAISLSFSGPGHPLLGSDDRPAATSAAPGALTGLPSSAAPAQSLDFDLLGDQGKQQVDPEAERVLNEMQTRRFLLTMHQTAGFALATLMVGTMITGQLSYSDRFGGASTGRYETIHSIFAISTEVIFAGTGALAIFAPVPVAPPKDAGWSRADIHRFGMLGATAGMLCEAGLGAWTASREGYADQKNLAAVHLALGYTTLAFMMVAVGAIVL